MQDYKTAFDINRCVCSQTIYLNNECYQMHAAAPMVIQILDPVYEKLDLYMLSM